MKHLKYYLNRFAKRIEWFVFSPWLFLGGVCVITVFSVWNLFPKQKPDGIEIMYWLGIYGVIVVSTAICLQFHGLSPRMTDTFRYKRAKFCTKFAYWIDDASMRAGILILAIPAILTMTAAYFAVFKLLLVDGNALLVCTFLPAFTYLGFISLIAFIAYEEKGWLVEAERYAQMEQSMIITNAANNILGITAEGSRANGSTIPISMSYTVSRSTDAITGEPAREVDPATEIHPANYRSPENHPNAASNFVLQTSATVRNAHDQWKLLHELSDRLNQAEDEIKSLKEGKVDKPKPEPNKNCTVNSSIAGLEVEEK